MAPKNKSINNVLTMNTSRIRRWIDNYGINSDLQVEIDKCNTELQNIRFESRPEEPSSENEEQHAEWRNYSSEKYTRLMTAYNLYKDLVHFRNTKEPSEELVNNLSGAPKPLKGESDDDYQARHEKYSAYKELTNSIDFSKPASVDKLMSSLEKKQNLQLCIRKDNMTAQKVRFNSSGLVMLTAACEELIRQYGAHAMKIATQYSKKTIQPSHVIGEGYTELPLFPLMHNLPHFEMLCNRQRRQAKYEESITRERALRHQKARKRCLAAGRVYTVKDRPDLSDIKSFEETEVENGFAKKENGTYLWRGIDYDIDDKSRGDFSHYIERLFNQLKITEIIQLKDGSHAEGFKISKSVKEFLSRIVVDFIQKMAPKLKMLLDLGKVKTIDNNMVLTAVKMSLVDLYNTTNGSPRWTEDHLTLFNKMMNTVKN